MRKHNYLDLPLSNSRGEGFFSYGKYLLLFLCMLTLAVSAFAIVPDPVVVTISPTQARCGTGEIEYTINVKNVSQGTDSIREVRIYDDVDGDNQRDAGIVSFTCGTPPIGWTLDDRLALYHYCQYETARIKPGDMIEPGENRDFTFFAQLDDASLSDCGNTFKVSTVDDQIPVGNTYFKFPRIHVDCEAPVVLKAVGTPKILMSTPGCDTGPFQGEGEDSCDYWITQSTVIDIDAYDNNTTDGSTLRPVNEQCDLGINFCQWRYRVDGGTWSQWSEHSNGEHIEFPISFGEDSEHEIEIECTDIVGNKTVVTETDKVDDTPPTTTKEFFGPKKIDGLVEWIDGITTVGLTSTDGGEFCAIGVDKIWYRNDLASNVIDDGPSADEVCYHPENYCNAGNVGMSTPYEQTCPGCIEDCQVECSGQEGSAWYDCVETCAYNDCYVDPAWKLYRGEPIPKDEESCHVLQYFSVDHIGNIEETNFNCFFVDKTPPVGTKEVGEPNVFWKELMTGADRLVETQNNDGTWEWTDPDTDPTDGTGACTSNVLGITALGLVDAYKLSGKTAYLNAAKVSGDAKAACGYNKTNDKYYSQDIEFLTELGEVTGDSTYTDKAVAIMEYFMTQDNRYCATDGCTAAELAAVYQGYYPAPDDSGLVEWQLASWVRAAQGTGKTSWANDMISEITADISGTPYFDISNTGQTYYIIGLAGVVSATGNAGAKQALFDSQNTDGGWSSGNPEGPTQDTAYAIMALIEAGEIDSAKEGAMWLRENQQTNGGWIGDSGKENTEVTSEAAQAIYSIAAEDGVWVRDHETPITLTCEDTGNHPSGDAEVCYQVSYDLEPFDLTSDYCTGSTEVITDSGYDGTWCCVPSTETITFEEDSRHDLEYFCRDAVNKKSEIDLEWFRVDSQPPKITKTMIPGTNYLAKVGTCPPTSSSDECYVMDGGTNGVHIAVEDQGINGCVVNNVTCTYQLFWEDNPTGGGTVPIDSDTFGEEGADVYFTQDSMHTLVVNCVDALGNPMTEDVEVFYVDSTPPVTTKTYGPEGTYKIDLETGAKWIDTATRITLTAIDEKVGVDNIYYKIIGPQSEDFYCQSESNCSQWSPTTPESGGWTTYLDPFNGMDESCHIIEYYSEDLLGNVEQVKHQCIFVDKTVPVVTKTPGDPNVPCATVGDTECDYYVTQGTPIKLSCTDVGPHPSNDVTIYWSYTVDGKDPVTGSHMGEAYDLYFPEDSVHNLDVWCVDAVGKESLHDIETIKVDTEAPTFEKIMNGPYEGVCPPAPGSNDVCFVDTATSIGIEVEDGGDVCAVGGVTCEWKYRLVAGNWTDLNSEFPIMFPEESEHELMVVCTDALGNSTNDTETFFVDKTPPGISKTYSGPYYSGNIYPDQEPSFWAEWINENSKVKVSVTDDGPHQSGIAEVKYRVTLVGDEYCRDYGVEDQYKCEDATGELDWTIVSLENYDGFEFGIADESCHLIEIVAKDNVDKENVHKQCVFVDNTPPTPEKTVGEPKDLWTPGLNGDPLSYFYPEETAHCWDETGESIDCWEVTTLTPIRMDCVDEGPHPVDHETVCFKVELDGKDKTREYCEGSGGCHSQPGYGEYNETTGYCCTVDEVPTFYFKEDSEHNLKYYCVDALGNTNEQVDEEKFKVEGTKFEIPLYKKWNLISVPFRLLSSAPQDVFTADKGVTDVNSVWTYDPSLKMCGYDWCVYTPDGKENDSLDSIVPGSGYWVMELADKETLTLGGSLFSTGPVAPPSKQLVPGWNLIGYYGTNWQMYDHLHDFESVCGFPSWGDYFLGDNAYCALNSLIDTQVGYPRWSSLWTYINCGNHHANWVGIDACGEGMQAYFNKMYAGRGYWVEMDVADLYVPATTCIWNDSFKCRWPGGGIIQGGGIY